MSAEISGKEVWEALLRASEQGEEFSEALAVAVSRMPSSVLAPYQDKVVNYQSLTDTREAVALYLVWAVPSENFSWWQKLELWKDQIGFTVGYYFSKTRTNDRVRVTPKFEHEIFSRFMTEEVLALYEQGKLTIGGLVLSQPALFFGEWWKD